MCWKQEWAMAINNLQHAIEHIEKAQIKLDKRKQRNEATIKRLEGYTKRYYDKFEVKKAEKRLMKNSEGIEECRQVIAALKEEQDELFQMVHKFGISKSTHPKRVYALMGKYPYAERLKKLRAERRLEV